MAKRSAWTWLFAAAVVAALAGVVAWLAGDGRRDAIATGSPPTSAPAPLAGDTRPEPPRSAAGANAGAAGEARPLPPVGTPFRATIEELQRRARAGEPEAMCRLAAEHARCKDIRQELDAASWMIEAEEARMAEVGADRRAARLARTAARSDEIIEASRHCDGVPEVDDRELFRQWRAAARAGSVAAMARYATGQAFPANRLLDLLPELAAYRHEAEAMAWRAVESGDTRVMLVLGMAYLPEGPRRMPSLLGQAVAPNPVDAAALLRLAQARSGEQGGRYLQVQLDRLEADMDAAQRGAVRDRMATLQRTLSAPGPVPDERARNRDAMAEACSAPPPPGR